MTRPGAVRTRRPPHRKWPYVLAAGLAVVLIGAAGYLLWFSTLFGLHSVQVVGGDGSLTESVREAVAVPDGTPLARIDLVAVTERVRKVPRVASATVTREWPNGLAVVVTERTPVAVTSANGTFWLLDSSGVPFQRAASKPAGLVVLELVHPGAEDPATRSALVAVGAMTADFRRKVGAVRATTAHDVTVLLLDGRTVIWGGADNGARKMQLLPALLAQPGKVFDISDPTLVTAR